MGLFDVEGGKNIKLKKAYAVEGSKYVKLKKAYVVEGGKYVKVWSGFEPFTLAGVTYSSQFELYKSTDFFAFSKVLSKTGDYGRLVAIDYAEGKYFCICFKSSNVNILVTEDGETFNVSTLNNISSIDQYNGTISNWLIFADNKYYLAFHVGTTVIIHSSSDGKTWTRLSDVTVSDSNMWGKTPLMYGYGNADVSKKKFYLSGMTSDDCITWSSCNTMGTSLLGEDGYIYYLSSTSTNSTIWLYKGSINNILCTLSKAPYGKTMFLNVQSPFNASEFYATAHTEAYKINASTGVVTSVSLGITSVGDTFRTTYRSRPAKKICSATTVSSSTYARYKYLSSESAWTYFTNITGISDASSNAYTIVHD